ncbi:FkbM family methyltransferase [Methylomonas rivi]|uniref:FkbM family methyltransferase n=1 Tax=Methylomonas rivi TaxID=2952226 RepID=A0ABT1U287_9GAMM|nr:FkbM family methyltransferase [Methylomonas sp. WSC-6]MBS3913925.1 FkbM family methyltransferase [Bacteroidota bacterium]MCQ8127948.1 FkbM family methyltransferase [Methylomonas sp. WSC-6]
MKKIYSVISRFPGYIRVFGYYYGIQLFFRVEVGFNVLLKSEKISKYYLPNYKKNIYLRHCVADRSIFWQCLVKNQYSFNRFPQSKRLMSVYDELVNSGQTPLIIDCGGNIGLSSFWYANRFPDAKIVVIEPDQANLDILTLNLEPFSGRVVILKGGVWNRKGFLKIVNPEAGSAAYRVEFLDEESDDSIRCYTINEICEKVDIKNPFIVKIDIEGSQKNLFQNNTEWVSKTNLITLELDDWLLPWQGTSRNFFSCLSQYSFDYLLNGESIFCFRDFYGDS